MLRKKAAFVILFAILMPPAGSVRAQTSEDSAVKGLRFTLREAPRVTPDARERSSRVANLPAADADAILKRLPPLVADSSDKTAFSIRQASLPPPKAGRPIPVAISPHAEKKTLAPSAPVEVIRATPNGRTSPATDLSITFSQPMIAVSDQKTAAANVPVRLSPEIPGKWRWLGTRTIVFKPENRFPAATKFTAIVPAGTRSASGGATEREFEISFETPAPAVSGFLPNDETETLQPVMFAEFNQRIDQAALLNSIRAIAAGREISLRLATQAEIKNDSAIERGSNSAPKGNWLAFVPTEKLPADAAVEIIFPAGIRSAEGEIPSASEQRFGFRTYGPLKFSAFNCDWEPAKGPCGSRDDLRLRFTQSIDEEKFTPSMIRVEPPVADLDFDVYSNGIRLDGTFAPNRKYMVAISPELTDVYGQRLGQKATAEFSVLPSEPQVMLLNTESNYMTLDPFGPPVVSLGAINVRKVRFRILEVGPNDFEAFRAFDSDAENAKFPEIGRVVSDRIFGFRGKPDEGVLRRIDLAPFFRNSLGFLIMIAEPADGGEVTNEQRLFTWIQSTRIALDSFMDGEGLTIFANDLRTGKPLENVEIELEAAPTVRTGSDGLAFVKWPVRLGTQGALTARLGDDRSFVPGLEAYDLDNLRNYEKARWFVFDDRGMYRPGERISVKGYFRRVTPGSVFAITEFGNGPRGFSFTAKDRKGAQFAEGRGELNVFGAFDIGVNIPQNVNLGDATIIFKLDDGEIRHTHSFKIQEFRRPEFEVSAETESRGPHIVGEELNFAVHAEYFSGGGLRSAPVSWRVYSRRTNFSPPGREQYVFGKENGWDEDARTYYQPPDLIRELNGETDAEGNHRIALVADAAFEPVPAQVTAEARVSDVNRQTYADTTTVLVHPANVYIGVRTETNFVGPGENLKVLALVTDLDGAPVSGRPFEVTAEFHEWRRVTGEWLKTSLGTKTCGSVSGAAEIPCDFQAPSAGTVAITAIVTDDRGRRNKTIVGRFVAGDSARPSIDLEEENLDVIANRDEYRPGDVAEILVNSPIYPAEGVMTIQQVGNIKTERFTMTSPTAILKVPVDESMIPKVAVSVAVFGTAKRPYDDEKLAAKLPPRPAFATGFDFVGVSTESRRLTVVATPQKEILEPGEKTRVDLEVRDHLGRPAAGAEIALVAADESVLALSGYKIDDPVGIMYGGFRTFEDEYFPRLGIRLADSDEILASLGLIPKGSLSTGFGYGSASGNGSGFANVDNDSLTLPRQGFYLRNMKEAPVGIISDASDPLAIRIRRNFDALAAFAPSVRTDAGGRAVVDIDLPDNLTRYRITAIATDGAKRFGKTESSMTARQRLMVRPSAARFLNFGDRAEIPVVVQNDSGSERMVNVAVRGTNAVFKEGNGRVVKVAAGDRAEVRFAVEAQSAGIARFQVAVVSDDLADAAEFAFPILTPANLEEFATYGSIKDEASVSFAINRPANVFSQFGGLEIATSATQLHELTDAFTYLQQYPYDCGEQIASRTLSAAAIRDVAKAFDARDVPSDNEIADRMNADFESLAKIQREDGGFGFWAGESRSDPFVSAHAAFALERARLAGFKPPVAMLEKVRGFLRNIDARIPQSYSPRSRGAIIAYSLYARATGGDRDVEAARQLFKSEIPANHSSETLGWLFAVFEENPEAIGERAAILKELLGRVRETASAASIANGYRDGDFVALQSNSRSDAVVLDAFAGVALEDRAVADLIPKLARGLLDGRRQGRWANTQENAFAVVALSRYFEALEKESPDFTSRVWLGPSLAGESAFKSGSAAASTISVPMDYLLKAEDSGEITLEKKGAGRMYYRVGYKFASRQIRSEAFDNGFEIVRTFEAADYPADVTVAGDGSLLVRAGARVRVRLQIYSRDARRHVAVVDRLAAGFEIINQDLTVSESLPSINSKELMNAGWFDHRNIRDDRLEIFAARLSGGVHYYEYFVRATAPGVFVAPPAKAEEMYSPETFGRSRSDSVTIR